MHERRADAPTQPLPTVERRQRRIPLGHLAASAASFWAAGAILFAGQGTPIAHTAPHCVRGAVWVIACGCFLAGLACLTCCAGFALEYATRTTAVARRRALTDAAPVGLAAGRERYRLMAEQAAGVEDERCEVPALRVVGGERNNGSRARYGA
jgi:hypothetical protein